MLERRGVRSLVLCSFPFERLGRTQAATLGSPALQLVLIDHPLGGIAMPQVDARILQALPGVRAWCREPAR